MHSCPDCGQACTCNGDIDDCFFEDSDEALHCTHWEECEQELEGEDDYSEDENEAVNPGRTEGA